jgi:hypothetical protein
MSYFLFVFNVIVGIFAAVKRLLISVVIGTFMLSRLDHVLLMKGFEKFDSAHTAYLSMLMVDVYHNHPVLRSFVELLRQIKESVSLQNVASESPEYDNKADGSAVELTTPLKKKRYRNLWFKLVTLINNPTLVLERLQLQHQQNMEAGAVEDRYAMKQRTQDFASFHHHNITLQNTELASVENQSQIVLFTENGSPHQPSQSEHL